MSLPVKAGKRLLSLLLILPFPFCTGCGGDAYEQQFQKSMKSLETTGEPLSKHAPAAGDAAADAAGNQPNEQPGNQAAK